MSRRLVLVLAVLALGWAALLSWCMRQPQRGRFHCGCYEPQCSLPCSSCCPGAQPSGCPPPTASDVRQGAR